MKIEIPSDCEKIHVLFSGGADSSLLSFLLLSQSDLPVTLHHMTNKKQDDYQLNTAKNIHDWLQEKFLKDITFQVWGKTFIRQAVEVILMYNTGYVFSGCNKVPENIFTPTRYIPHDTPPVRGPAFSNLHIRPFIDMVKPELYELYCKYNILDLFNLTVSCGIPKKTKKGYEPCNECFFCLERLWGMHTL